MGALGPPFPSLVHLPRPANPCFGGCGRGAWRQEGWGQLLDTHASVHSRIASVRQEWGLEMSLSLEAHLRGSNSVGPGRSLDSSFLTSPIWSVGRRGWGPQFRDTALNPWDLPPSRASSQLSEGLSTAGPWCPRRPASQSRRPLTVPSRAPTLQKVKPRPRERRDMPGLQKKEVAGLGAGPLALKYLLFAP